MNHSILSNKSIKIFFEAWWAVWTVMQFIILNQLDLNFKFALTDSILGTVLLAAICYFISNNMKYYLPRREKYWYILVVSAVGSTLYIFTHRIIFGIFISEETSYM